MHHFLRPLALTCLVLAGLAAAEPLSLGIMQALKGEAEKHKALADWLGAKGSPVRIVGISNYADAARKFQAGEVQVMVAGSGLAGCLLVKGLVSPLARPVNTEGFSTYWAVVVAKKGAAPFAGDPAVFAGKRVIATQLASSGEFFWKAITAGTSVKATIKYAGNHGAALDALNTGAADYAIVKNRVWDQKKAGFAELAEVGKDGGENPDNVWIVAKTVPAAQADALKAALLAVEGDAGGAAARGALGIKGFLATGEADYVHTLGLLKKAGITADTDLATLGK